MKVRGWEDYLKSEELSINAQQPTQPKKRPSHNLHSDPVNLFSPYFSLSLSALPVHPASPAAVPSTPSQYIISFNKLTYIHPLELMRSGRLRFEAFFVWWRRGLEARSRPTWYEEDRRQNQKDSWWTQAIADVVGTYLDGSSTEYGLELMESFSYLVAILATWMERVVYL